MQNKSGFVAISGRPNVGKSSLVNKVVNFKVAITSYKAQTTRNVIQGIYNDETSQIIFVDTPGIHKAKTSLGQIMNKSALAAIKEVDVILLLVEIEDKPIFLDENLEKLARSKTENVILVINKIDKAKKEEIYKKIDQWTKAYGFKTIIPVSAKSGENVDNLIKEIKTRLKAGPKFYPSEMVSDHPQEFLVQEVIREKILLLAEQEVPHSVAVYLESFKLGETKLKIDAVIVVEKDTHKGIIIGKQGSMLKMINDKSVRDLAKMFDRKVELSMFVKVEKDWRNKPTKLKDLGY
jgi:GTP-binding protein Era